MSGPRRRPPSDPDKRSAIAIAAAIPDSDDEGDDYRISVAGFAAVSASSLFALKKLRHALPASLALYVDLCPAYALAGVLSVCRAFLDIQSLHERREGVIIIDTLGQLVTDSIPKIADERNLRFQDRVVCRLT